jgi:SpoVK/Ycf46/Vps4 family AAA+-type ATPase
VLSALPTGRGRAITALFDGDSGTGKTFSCEVIAAEVGLPLMRVNVSSLVDKYIGETEKNLTRVFTQAQAQGGILFFDEADALFGTRTDVSRAQDRYANLETNLLLQLMEQFSGVVLLTTNLKKNIDQAFMRRIMFKVYFDTPEEPERERLWRTILGSSKFADDVDFRRLAKVFELSGGSIRAALLRAPTEQLPDPGRSRCPTS